MIRNPFIVKIDVVPGNNQEDGQSYKTIETVRICLNLAWVSKSFDVKKAIAYLKLQEIA